MIRWWCNLERIDRQIAIWFVVGILAYDAVLIGGIEAWARWPLW